MKYDYVWVSILHQDLEGQMRKLEEESIDKQTIKVTGLSQLQKLKLPNILYQLQTTIFYYLFY